MNTSCRIAGGGPAGIIAGYLLARAGVDVTVVEKHADFFRDFVAIRSIRRRCGSWTNSGISTSFTIPHSEFKVLDARFGEESIPAADFRHVPGRSKFMAIMPQWDLLAFCAPRRTCLRARYCAVPRPISS